MIHKKRMPGDRVEKFTLIFMICIFGFLITGCGVWKVNRNIKNLNELKFGMTKKEVVNLMGTPSQSVGFEGSGGKAIEILFYNISLRGDHAPLVLEDGILVGWGDDYRKQRLPNPSIPEAPT